jgi:carboxymethylenebutenolidase
MPVLVTAPVPDGAATAHLLLPDAPRPAPLVVLYMDAFGVRPTLFEMAGRLVDAGYAVLLPDLYWRSGPFAPFDPSTAFVDPGERARIFGLMNAVSPAQVIADTAALLDALDPAQVRTDAVGLLGYCMGGRQALFVAAALGPRVAAMASIHGGGLVRPDPSSPHLGAPRITATLYFAVADDDASCTAADCEVLRAALTAAGVAHTLELYPGDRHGFAVPDSPAFDADAAERHWARVTALMGGALS